MYTFENSRIADLIVLKTVARRLGLAENAVLQAVDELPEPIDRFGRVRFWHESQWPEIAAAMKRRAERRHNRGGTGGHADAA